MSVCQTLAKIPLNYKLSRVRGKQRDGETNENIDEKYEKYFVDFTHSTHGATRLLPESIHASRSSVKSPAHRRSLRCSVRRNTATPRSGFCGDPDRPAR